MPAIVPCNNPSHAESYHVAGSAAADTCAASNGYRSRRFDIPPPTPAGDPAKWTVSSNTIDRSDRQYIQNGDSVDVRIIYTVEGATEGDAEQAAYTSFPELEDPGLSLHDNGDSTWDVTAEFGVDGDIENAKKFVDKVFIGPPLWQHVIADVDRVSKLPPIV